MRSMIAAVLLVQATAHAAIIALSFTELVRKADDVFVGEVSGVQPRILVQNGSEKIVTDVTFRVTKVLKGRADATRVLVFAGGTVGDRTFTVEDVPTFTVGERDVIFAMTTATMSPIVGMAQGRFRIVKEAASGRDIVQQSDGTPVRDVAAIGAAPQPAIGQKASLSLAELEAAVSSLTQPR
jgi:hypothetical protein